MVSDDDQKKHWKLSVEHAAEIEHKCAQEGKTITPIELKEEVYKWAAVDNKGITHYGCTPDEFPMSEVWPDFFHLDCAITKSLMTRLRNMVLGAGMDFREGFHCRIKRFFNDYHFSLWDLNKSLSSFKGKDCRAFIKNAASLADWIENQEHLVTAGD